MDRALISIFLLIIVVWSRAADTLGHNARLKSNNLVRNSILSQDQRFNLVMQSDCNLVLYRTSDHKALWASSTYKKSTGCYVLLQGNGNLVIYNGDDVAIWDSDTIDASSKDDEQYRLVTQNDGNVVIYTSDNKATWATNTVAS